MTPKTSVRKIRQKPGSPQDNPNEMTERWKQLPLNVNLAKAMRFISLIGGLVTLLLVARIGLKLIVVNPGTPFGRLVVYLTDLFLWPFSSMTETLSAPHVTLLELSSLTAVILYPFAAWVLIRLLEHVFPLRTE